MEQKSPVINPRELVMLYNTTKLVIVDASAGPDSKMKYAAKHLEGALFVDLNTDLADIKSNFADGGRHPLPTPVQFSRILTQLGITPLSHVIIYDDKNGSNASARMWWMLKSIGHNKVQVVDGGFDAAIDGGFPLSSKEESAFIQEPYNVSDWLLPLSGIDEVERVAHDKDFLIIDVRDRERFNGEKEPIDLIAGHIPGAINIPFTGNLDAMGFFLSPDELRNKYLNEINNRKPGNIIVHCGSGVTACHTLLAMAYAGLEIPKLYVGSWSEWSRSNRPVATILNDK